MNRRSALKALAVALAVAPMRAANPSVSTLIGTGAPGESDQQVNNPYGLALGPDGDLYFCDLDNQRIRRLDLQTHLTHVVAGTGEREYAGDGGLAPHASLNMPHEIQFDPAGHLYIAERDNHVVRRIDRGTGVISTVAGTGHAGFSGDGGRANHAELRQPHSLAIDAGRNRLLICDTGNHRLRQVELATGRIETIGGTGKRRPTSDGARLAGAPLDGPRTLAFDARGHAYLALREGNAIYRIDMTGGTLHHVAGTGHTGYTGDGSRAREAALGGPKGLAWAPGRLFVADTENHAIRCIDLDTGVIRTVLGTGQRGDGPEPDPRQCALSRPHSVLVVGDKLYVGDSEAHRIRVVAGVV